MLKNHEQIKGNTAAADETTMQAIRYHGPGEEFHLEKLAVPTLQPREVLVRVRASGICHTELHLLNGTLNLGVAPLIPGHEIAGEIVQISSGVSEVAVGDRVVIYYYKGCGHCKWCRSGQENLCPNIVQQFGFTDNGGYAEYIKVNVSNIVKLPDDVSFADAATLGCSATTALHAANRVAQVKLNEWVVVYGVGAVGYALIQVCKLAGARVIAIGRTQSKLDMAKELGADFIINADQHNPAVEVLRLTNDEGADTVFELVGVTTTMENSLVMLRRRGRMVFVGYSQYRLLLNPLQLIVKELQILSSVGNSYSELEEVVEMAAQGRLHTVIERSVDLSGVNEALQDLAAGKIRGRIVIEPTPLNIPVMKEPTETEKLDADLINFINQGLERSQVETNDEFNSLALRVFAYQFNHNEPYQKYCLKKEVTPATVKNWRDIPAVPIGAFKATTLSSEPIEKAAAVFMSSGTTAGPEKKSRHYHPHLGIYNASVRNCFAGTVVPDLAVGSLRMYSLFPSAQSMPNSSLAYWLNYVMNEFGSAGSRFLMDEKGFDLPTLVRVLREAEQKNEPICLLGASFSFVHFFDQCEQDGLRFKLPPNSRVMDTGGFKGKSREITRYELYQLANDYLGVPREMCVNMYGMTEHSTQFIDSSIRDHTLGIRGPRRKIVPPWCRTLVVDPQTLEELPEGEIGLLMHYDLGNRNSVMAVLSEDMGYALNGGFELLGRAKGAEARGCSVAVDELLEALGDRQ